MPEEPKAKLKLKKRFSWADVHTCLSFSEVSTGFASPKMLLFLTGWFSSASPIGFVRGCSSSLRLSWCSSWNVPVCGTLVILSVRTRPLNILIFSRKCLCNWCRLSLLIQTENFRLKRQALTDLFPANCKHMIYKWIAAWKTSMAFEQWVAVAQCTSIGQENKTNCIARRIQDAIATTAITLTQRSKFKGINWMCKKLTPRYASTCRISWPRLHKIFEFRNNSRRLLFPKFWMMN